MPTPEYIRTMRQKIGNDLLYLPGVVAVVVNAAGEVLLQRRSDNGQWNIVSGILEPGEEPADCAAREVWEEAGIRARPVRLAAVFADPDTVVRYPNGDQCRFLTLVFRCEPLSGMPIINDEESLEIGYFAPEALPDLGTRHMRYLQAALRDDPTTHFEFNGLPE